MDVWTRRFREEGDRLWTTCSESYGGRVRIEIKRWSARWWRTRPDGGGPAKSQALSQLPFAPPFFRMTAPKTLGDFMKTESGPNWEQHIHGGSLWSSLGWMGWLPGSLLPRGLQCLSSRLTARVAAGVAVVAAAAAVRQLELGSRPAGTSQEAGDRGSGRCRGRRRAGAGGTLRGLCAGRRAGWDCRGPRGNPDETVVNGKQHSGQRDAEEVGADRGQAQPASSRALTQSGATRALATVAHAAGASHPRSPLSPDAQTSPTPVPKPRPLRRIASAS